MPKQADKAMDDILASLSDPGWKLPKKISYLQKLRNTILKNRVGVPRYQGQTFINVAYDIGYKQFLFNLEEYNHGKPIDRLYIEAVWVRLCLNRYEK